MEYVAKALVYDTNQSILVLTRSDTHPRYPLHDDLPGGEVDSLESHTTGMVRELQEEIGWIIAPESLRLVACTQHTDTMTYLLYEVSLATPPAPIKLSWEHSDFRWESLDTVLSLPQPEGCDSYFKFCLEYLHDNARQ